MFAASRRRVAVVALAALPLVGCASRSTSIPASEPVATTTLLARLGADTVAVEQFTRTARHMDGTLVTRLPATRVSRYSVDLGPSGAPVRADLSVRDGLGAPLPSGLQSLSVRFAHDSATFIGHRSASDTSQAFAVRGPVLPALPMSYALYELALARMSFFGRDSVEFASVPLVFGTRGATPRAVRVVSRDSVRVAVDGGPLLVRYDRGGRIVGVDGARTTFKVRVERVDSLDLASIARAWGVRERKGTSAGQASTRDTTRASVPLSPK
jgi:hypothetical protein